jgi:hypothetical protein
MKINPLLGGEGYGGKARSLVRVDFLALLRKCRCQVRHFHCGTRARVNSFKRALI